MASWRLYKSTKEAFEAIIEQINLSRETIDIECFYFEPDETGKRFIEALLNARDRGVKIRCLFDTLGSFNLSGIYLRTLTDSHIEVEFFNWFSPWSQKSKKWLYFRDHRRTFIFDKKIAFTGGICIGDATINWRDTVVKFEGVVVEQALQAFNWMWIHARKRNVRIHPEPQFTIDSMMYSTQSPLPRQRYLYYQIVRSLRNAKEEVLITTPYFLPDYKIMRLIKRACKRGVHISLIVPKNSDHPVVDLGAQSFFTELLEYGVHIYRHEKMIHAKTIVIDPHLPSAWSLTGSMNMDNISLRYNFEAGLVSTDLTLIQELNKHFQEDKLSCERLDISIWKKRGLIQKIKELLVWPIRKFL